MFFLLKYVEEIKHESDPCFKYLIKDIRLVSLY